MSIRGLFTLKFMRATFLRLAESATKQPLSPREAAATLLPPLPLYRRLLRVHRNLTPEMRDLGDVYVKSEFRRHKDVTNPAHIIGFLCQWKAYLDQMPNHGGGESYRGKKLDPTLFEKMSPEQISQLHEFLNATRQVWKGPS